MRKARLAARILLNRRENEPARTRARQTLEKYGVVTGDVVKPNEGGDRRRVEEKWMGTVRLSSVYDPKTGERKQVFGGPMGYKDVRDKTPDKILRFIGNHLGAGPAPIVAEKSGILPSGTSKTLNRLTKRGLLAGGRGVMEALIRPGQAVESGLGKTLVASGAIKDNSVDDVGHKIARSRGPWDILTKGNRYGLDTGGADILEGVTGSKGARTGGIFVDLATDPLMYVGVGALAKGSAATAAKLTARIEAAGVEGATEALQGLKIKKLTELAHETGDSDPLLGELHRIANEHGISTRALGRTKAERAAKKGETARQKQARVDETRQIMEDIKAGKAVGQESESGRNLYVPDVAGQEAVKSTVRLAKQRELRPGARIRLMDPLGREHASIPLPIPKRLANLPLTGGLVTSKAGKRALAQMRLSKKAHAEVVENQRMLSEIDTQRRRIKVEKAARQRQVGLERAENEYKAANKLLDDTERVTKQNLESRLIAGHDATVDDIRTNFINTQSLSEKFERGNRQRLNRIVAPTADEFGRTTQMRFYQQVLHGIEDHLGNLNDPKIVKSLEKIQLHRFARSDTGSQSALRKAGVKLTPKEQSVMRELDKVDAQMAKFGTAVGTLKERSILEDYGGPRIWNPEGTSVDQIVENINSRLGSSSFFAHHRGHPAVSDLAGQERLANKISELSDRNLPIEEARAHAEEWHQTAMVRNAQELMSRQAQRGGDTLTMDELPPTFQRAAHLAENMTPKGSPSTVPLLNIDKTEGLGGTVKLNRSEASQHAYGLPSIDPIDVAPEQALTSINADLDRIGHIRQTTKSGTQYDKDLRKWSRRLRVQKAALEREQSLAEYDKHWPADHIDDDIEQLQDMRDSAQALADTLENKLGTFNPMYPEEEKNLQDQLSELMGAIHKLDAELNRRMVNSSEFDFEDLNDELGLTSIPGQGASMTHDLERMLSEPGGPLGPEPFKDVIGDITSHLPDFRESSFFPILDMRNSYFYRTRSEGVNAAFRSRWKGIDKADGRDVTEADATYRSGDGTEGRVADLEQWEILDNRSADRTNEITGAIHRNRQALRDSEAQNAAEYNTPELRDSNDAMAPYFERDQINRQHDQLNQELGQDQQNVQSRQFWYDRRLDRIYEIDEVQSSAPALVPNIDRTRFWDLSTQREYAYPHHVIAMVGEKISDVVQPTDRAGERLSTRVWPVDAIHAADMEAKRAGEYDIVFKTGMESGLGKVLSNLRYGVTSLWPAYHTRNAMSDMLKSMQADSGVLFHPIANAQLAATAFRQGKAADITIKGLGKMSSEDFLLMADAFGLRSGHHVAEVSRIAETGEFPVRGRGSRIARSLGPSGTVGTKAVDFGIRREDMTRFITFAQRMRQNGGDAADAMMYMVKHHFNYNDLSITEKRVIRNLFLFYTWYRKNIPLQLAELFHRPGFMSGVAHSYNALERGETPVNQDWSQLNPMFPDLSGKMPKRGVIPDYLQDRLSSVGTSWNGHAAMFGFGAPWADLSLLRGDSQAIRDWVAMLNPAITTAAQLGFGQDLLTGREFKAEETGGPSNVLDAALKAAGLNGLPTDNKGRPVMPWALKVVLSNTVPGLGRLFGTFETPSTQRDTGRLQQIGKKASFIHGINIYVSPKAGSAREELALTKRVQGRAAERGELLTSISNLPQGDAEKRVKEFDRQTLIWANQRGIPRRILESVKATGYYKGKTRQPAGSGLGSGRGGMKNLGGGKGLDG